MDKEQEKAYLERNKQQLKEGQEIMREIADLKLTNYAYPDDAQFMMSGKLMTQILSLLQNHQLHSSNMQAAYENLHNAQNAMIAEDTSLLLACMRLHIDNCKNGIAVPQKEKNKADAKVKIQPLSEN